MYNNYRALRIVKPNITPVVSPVVVQTLDTAAPASARDWRGVLSTVVAGLPFVAALLMIVGFGIAIYPLVVHFLPVFASQSALN